MVYRLTNNYHSFLYLAKDLVKGLLTIDPNKRLTVRQALEHPFIVSYEIIKILIYIFIFKNIY